MPNSTDMKDFVIGYLRSGLPAHYHYHNYEHTLYVLDKALEIGRHEQCSAAELNLLSAAALWHDTGYVKTYTDHEEAGCELAREYLPGYGFSPAETDQVCGMIMATKIPQSPGNKLEAIIADADLEYLGTEEAGNKAGDFFRELKYANPSLTQEAWDQIQIGFLQQHRYFTAYCQANREPVKAAYLEKLLNR